MGVGGELATNNQSSSNCNGKKRKQVGVLAQLVKMLL